MQLKKLEQGGACKLKDIHSPNGLLLADPAVRKDGKVQIHPPNINLKGYLNRL